MQIIFVLSNVPFRTLFLFDVTYLKLNINLISDTILFFFSFFRILFRYKNSIIF